MPTSPAIPEMAQSLNADVHRIEQSLSLFMFGTAFGQVVGGSVSDIKGRKPVALTGLTVILPLPPRICVSSAEQLLNLRVAGIRCGHDCGHRRRNGARLLFLDAKPPRCLPLSASF